MSATPGTDESNALGHVVSILDSTTDAFVALDRNWRFIYLNRQAERLLRRARTELLGVSVWQAFPAAAGSEFEAQFRRAVREHVALVFEQFFAPVETWLEVRVHPSDDGLAIFFRDINQRREAEEALRASEERLRLALQAAQMGTWDWNIVTGELRWSESLEAMFGLPPGGFGKSVEAFRALVHPEDRDQVAQIAAAVLQDAKESGVEFRAILPDGSVRWLEARGAVLRDPAGQAVRMLGAVQDVTERKQSEVERRRLVEREQAARAVAAAAAEADRLKTELINTASHELRTPLAAIKGFTTLLRDYFDRLPEEEQRGFLAEIDGAADRLQRLVEDLLRVAQLESGALAMERAPVSLAGVLVSAVHDARRRCPDRAIALDVTEGVPPVLGDARRLGQVAANLLDNAVKYSPAGSPVEVQVRSAGDGVEFTVTDHGIGIAPEHQDRIFERFYQVDSSRSRDIGGMGLGLAICRYTVQSHGGAIGVQSAEGQGSTFTVRLPLLPQPD
jgi:PAS domain S-box-containing protein